MSLLSYIIPQRVYETSTRYNKKIEVREINGKNVLLVNGIEQTGSYSEKLWRTGLQGMHPKDVLVFGVGGGTVFRKFPESRITGVDLDGEILHIAKKYFGLHNTTLIKRDARLFDTNKKYDLVIVDLYIGNDVPEFVTTKDFLLKCKRFLRNGGQMVINYFSEKDQEKKAAEIALYFKKVHVKAVLRNMFIYVVK